MPIRYHLKPDQKLASFVHVGAVTDDEFLSFYRALYADSRFDQSFNLLVDLRQTDSSVRSSGALDSFAGFMQRQLLNSRARPKVAVIAPQDISFGLARMYAAFARDVPWEFEVFRAPDRALAWLGLPESLVNELEQE